MKKLFFLAITFVTFTTYLFAKDPINSVVLNSFNKTYAHATGIEWTVTKDFIRAKFILDGEILYAYYTQAGDRMAVTRNIHTSQLPMTLASTIKTKFPDYYLADLFEVSSETETFYYATVRKGNQTIVLKASPLEPWRVYRKQKV